MSSTAATAPAKNVQKKAGLAFWMQRVLEECDRAGVALAPDPVHDLRVALRRCRSLADGLMVVDRDPAWKGMKRAGKQLFSSLGDLRDLQVMEEWVHRLDIPGDPVTGALLQVLAAREAQLKQEASRALQEFDRKQWAQWSKLLPHRTARLKPGGTVFKHLALERWTQAYDLHRRAMRNRSQVGFHRLRIGIKRFRYTVENFLPRQHVAWTNDLKQLQDWLGDVHDLDVLWSTALAASVLPDDETRVTWHARILKERDRRVEQYRSKMVGKTSLWQVWRAGLPQGEQIKAGALNRLKTWASFLDSDAKHTNHVTQLALQLYDGLALNRKTEDAARIEERDILRVAAMLHDVGRSKREKGHHKATYRLVDRLAPPLGWSASALHLAGVVARYHRGALPHAGQKTLRGLSAQQRQVVLRLAGILRLAAAFDAARDGRIQRLDVQSQNGFLVVAAQGYSPRQGPAEAIASARHLLEVVYRRPIMVKPLRPSSPKRAAS